MPPPALSDAELAARCRLHDPRAWDELVGRFSGFVRAIAVVAYRLPEADAEDVRQEVFSRVFQRLGSLRDDEALRPWIASLTRHLCVDALRRNGREQPTAELPEPACVDVAVEDLDRALSVRDAVATLPPACREVLVRFYRRDESYRTIASALGVPAGTVASRISRCLGLLRLALGAGAATGRGGRRPGATAAGPSP